MNSLPSSVLLPARHLFEIPGDSDVDVRVVTGTLWLTIDGEPDDIVLDPGDRFTAPRQRRVLAYALDNARFTLDAVRRRGPAVHATAPSWWQQLARPFHAALHG